MNTITTQDLNPAQDSDSTLKQRLLIDRISGNLKENPLAWGKWYCPHYFRMPSPGFHYKILAEAMKHRFFAVAAPRESAKSTILAFLRLLHATVYKLERFIVILSNTEDKAIGSLASIKEELKSNERLRSDFGVTLVKDNESDTVLSHPDGFKVRFLCKGHKQMGSVRGERFGAWRPTLILCDDLEDDELVKNPQRRRELQTTFDEAIVPAKDSEVGKVHAIGTILHDDSLMAKMVSTEFYPEFRKLFYVARKDSSGAQFSLWPEKWTVDALNKMERDKPEVFAKEYQNNPLTGIFANFKKEYFRLWEIKGSDYVLYDDQGAVVGRGSLSDCRGAISCDLAWEEKKTSDFAVIMPGFLTPESDLLIDYYTCKKGLRPHETEEILFSLEQRMSALTKGTIPIGVEKAMLEKVTKYLIRGAMKRRNKFLLFKDLKWEHDKIKRIVSVLEPRYANRSVYHRKGMGDLEYQLMRIPHGAHDDLPDAAQGLVQLLQYPKRRKKEKKLDTHFEWLRDRVVAKKNKPRYVFGAQRDRFPFRTHESFL